MKLDFKETVDRERFIRWQSILRDHLTFSNNLLLTISIAIIGFSIDLLSAGFKPICSIKFFFTVAMVAQFLSVIAGIITVLSRLTDFRGTLKKIRDGEDFGNWYGQLTWAMLYTQFALFGAGFLLLGIAIGGFYAHLLF